MFLNPHSRNLIIIPVIRLITAKPKPILTNKTGFE